MQRLMQRLPSIARSVASPAQPSPKMPPRAPAAHPHAQAHTVDVSAQLLHRKLHLARLQVQRGCGGRCGEGQAGQKWHGARQWAGTECGTNEHMGRSKTGFGRSRTWLDGQYTCPSPPHLVIVALANHRGGHGRGGRRGRRAARLALGLSAAEQRGAARAGGARRQGRAARGSCCCCGRAALLALAGAGGQAGAGEAGARGQARQASAGCGAAGQAGQALGLLLLRGAGGVGGYGGSHRLRGHAGGKRAFVLLSRLRRRRGAGVDSGGGAPENGTDVEWQAAARRGRGGGCLAVACGQGRGGQAGAGMSGRSRRAAGLVQPCAAGGAWAADQGCRGCHQIRDTPSCMHLAHCMRRPPATAAEAEAAALSAPWLCASP